MTEPTVPRDAMGIRAPERLSDVFFGRREMADWCNRLKQMRAELALMTRHQFGKHIPLKDLQKQMEAVRIEVLHAAPYVLCDCPAREQNCPKCNGDRWTSGKQSLKELSPTLA